MTESPVESGLGEAFQPTAFHDVPDTRRVTTRLDCDCSQLEGSGDGMHDR